ncbi:hypothetical protein SBOR_9827 [Sclerotinia borealis F-4128]|uniref:Pentatricopeptide repeat domain-containing protein n=1 Tax=Sclerotinia borealis (strain F-4128) TaxID=1432307 RepID=W9C4G7_SCLBF|nr:hypothetical protein SBOR_9827 [Sclerotinia borealis F-4128]
MQSLWLRTAQTRSSCHCNACVKIGTGIARQATTAIGKSRRVSIGDIFTACYSTIFATAAVVDSNRKVQRREQWDRLIAEVKAGPPADKVEGSQDCQEEGNANEAKNQIPGTPGTLRIPGVSSNNFPFARAGSNATKGPMTWNGANWTAASSMSRLGTHLNTIPSHVAKPVESPAPEYPQNPVPSPTVLPVQSTTQRETANSIVDGEQLGEHVPTNAMLQPRDPKTREHLAGLERSVTELVHQLMWTTNTSPITADFHSAPSDIFLETEKMIGRVEQLQQGDITMPAYQMNDEVRKERSQLHDALRALLKNTSPSQNNLNLILTKICYNLLISAASPNIFTYNFLIERMTELMLHDHAQVFVDSFLHDTLFRPTSKTIQVILNHYAAKNDLEGYRGIIRRMRALDGSMKVGRRHKNQLDNPGVLAWAERHSNNNRLVMHGGWLVRKVPRDASIFDALIRTSLQITTARQSVMYIRAALREGHKIRPELFVEAVQSCVAKLDHAAGESLLQSILEFWAENIQKPDLIALTKSTRWAMRELLHLCGIDPSRDLPRLLSVDVPRWNSGRLLLYLRLGSMRDCVDRFVERIRSLQDALRISSKRSKSTTKGVWKDEFGDTRVWDYLPPNKLKRQHGTLVRSGVDRSLEIFDKFSYTEKERDIKAKQGARQARRVMLQSLESKVALSKAHIRTTEIGITSWYCDQLPRDWIYTYHLRLQQNPHMSVRERIIVLRGLKRLQELDVFDYQLDQSLRRIKLLKKEFRNIRQRRERQISDITAQFNACAKQIKLLGWQFYLLKQTIISDLPSLRSSGLQELEEEINKGLQQIKILDQELNLNFPHANPMRTLRELNLVLFEVHNSKEQVKLLAEEIYLSYPPLVTRKIYVQDSYKIVRGFRAGLSFMYEPPKDKLSSTEEQGYEVIRELSLNRTIRFKKREEHSSDETIVSPQPSETSAIDEKISGAS